jgi:regulator of protease activity HflC (stomatin/prohibitin superfamily)
MITISMNPKQVIRNVGIGVAAFVALFIVLSSFTIVRAGERGIVLRWGAVEPVVLNEGLHWLVPFEESVVKMDVRTQKLESAKSEAYSKDLQVVDIHSAINYNLDAAAAGSVYQKLGLQYESKVIAPQLEAAVKQTVAKYTAESLLQDRAKVQSEIEETLRTTLTPYSIQLEKYVLVNETFSPEFEASIERKQVAEQDALTAKNKLDQVKYEADQTVASAKAQAEAIKIQAEAVHAQGGADYVQLQAIAKWNGVLPTSFVPGSAVPFLNLK